MLTVDYPVYTEVWAEVLPTFDRDRVYLADIKKLISWYNLLVACGITDFEDTAEAETTEEGKTEE